ncbi:uncharacterized protein LOC125825120 [Solanum verrucosum]|uniref:uncharacterized protein LOC125825120 n=1 Tax=Solanum verrucosum TaxID=315347 RepID=UPI0020D192E0|nr:uncharacterized protein LOC125825120 [Solanum verrucosum]
MTTSRAHVERNEEDNVEQEISLQAPPQVPIVPIGENVNNEKVRLVFLMLSQVMTDHLSRVVVAPVNSVKTRAILRVRDFRRMNPPEFNGSKEGEGHQEMKSRREGGVSFLSTQGGCSSFVYGKKWRMAMLYYDMNTSHLGFFSLQIEKEKLEEGLRERKRLRIEDEKSSLERSFGQDFSKFLPKFSGERVSNPKPKTGSNSESVLLKPTCKIYGRNNYGRCLAGMEGYYCCGRGDHKIRDCPVLTTRGRERKKSRSDALQARGEQECPPNVATGMCFMLTFILVVLVFCDLINWT